MNNPDFWRDLAEGFRRADGPFLRADWCIGDSLSVVVTWHLVGFSLHKLEFEALARRGGSKLTTEIDSLVAWMEALRGGRVAEGTAEELDAKGSTVSRILFGTISDPFRESVNLCKEYESLALVEEQPARKVSPTDSPLRSDKTNPRFPKRAMFFEELLGGINSRQISKIQGLTKMDRKTVSKCLLGGSVTKKSLSRIVDGLRTLGKYRDLEFRKIPER